MSHQCVPRWDNHDDINLNNNAKLDHLQSSSNSIPRDVSSMLDYEVAELTWENGQPGMNGLGQPRVPFKLTSISEMTWEKPRAGGTLESIVDQATSVPRSMQQFMIGGSHGNELVPWFQHHRSAATTVGGAGVSATVTMDAMVPCSNGSGNNNHQILQPLNSVSEFSNNGVGCSTRADSCSVSATRDHVVMKKRSRVMAPVSVAPTGWSNREQSVSGSATFDKDSPHLTVDTLGFTSISTGSPDNTSSDKLGSKTTIGDDDDSVFLNIPPKKVDKVEEKKKGNNRKSSVSTKRSRAAAVHNQSERKRRDKINERMKTLQKMVPNSSKTDKASMLDEVIEYLKQLQAQHSMMSTMNMSPLMLPLAMQQQQLQMSMMGPMGLGPMGMGMGLGVMDMSTMGRHNMAAIPPVLHPSPFMTLPSWDATGDRLPIPLHDPLATFAVCQPQQMTMEAYSRMAALYQQMHHQQGSSSKS